MYKHLDSVFTNNLQKDSCLYPRPRDTITSVGQAPQPAKVWHITRNNSVENILCVINIGAKKGERRRSSYTGADSRL